MKSLQYRARKIVRQKSRDSELRNPGFRMVANSRKLPEVPKEMFTQIMRKSVKYADRASKMSLDNLILELDVKESTEVVK